MRPVEGGRLAPEAVLRPGKVAAKRGLSKVLGPGGGAAAGVPVIALSSFGVVPRDDLREFGLDFSAP